MRVQNLLRARLSVVADFSVNTINQGVWFKKIFTEYNQPHQLCCIKASDELCIRQLKMYSANIPQGTALTTEAEFHIVSSYIQPPAEKQRFTVKIYDRDSTQAVGVGRF
jgi:hypothetical protein